MSWLVWLIAGAILGWSAEGLFKRLRPLEQIAGRTGDPAQGALDDSKLPLLSGVLDAVRSLKPRHPDSAAGNAASARPNWGNKVVWQALCAIFWIARAAAILIVLIVLVWFAWQLHFRAPDPAFHKIAQLFRYDQYDRLLNYDIYKIEAFVLSRRILALGSGIALGFWARRHRSGIGEHFSSFYKALLGNDHKSSWALQSAVAILAFFLIILALKPDFIDHLESLKAGDVEAKFSNVSTTTREAGRVTFSIFHTTSGLDQWSEYPENFGIGSWRDKVDELFDESKIKAQRKWIREKLFNHYFVPLIILLGCLDDNHWLGGARRSSQLAELAESLRSRILRASEAEIESSPFSDSKDWVQIIHRINDEIAQLIDLFEQEIFTMDPKIYKSSPDKVKSDLDKRLGDKCVSHDRLFPILLFYADKKKVEDRTNDDAPG